MEKNVTIGGKEYSIGTAKDTVTTEVKKASKDGDQVTVNGKTYTYTTKAGTNKNETGWVAGSTAPAEGATLDIKTADFAAKDGDKITLKLTGKEAVSYAVADFNADGVSKSDSSVISADKAIKLITNELTAANNIGTTGQAATIAAGTTYDAATGATFTINKGYAEVADKLSFSLHVGSDADMTNKITVDIETMNSSYLGIKGLNVNDDSGIAGTYAVDAISDALQKVSEQRSSLGAVQNRLEHTIDNLDNVVENTTTAESRIRDTDMASEMVNYSKNNILAQAGQSMLAQANQSNQGVLSLLQ